MNCLENDLKKTASFLPYFSFRFRHRKKKWKSESGQDSCDSIPEDKSPTGVKNFKSEPFDDDGSSSDSDVNDAFMENVVY